MPKTTKAYVRNVRLATANDIEKIDSIVVKKPVYDIALLDKIKTMDADSVSKFMNGQTAKNRVVSDKTVSAGFVSIFDVIKKDELEYADIGGHKVTVLTVIDGNKALIEDATVKGIDGYTVYVAINETTVFMCPSQSDCWIFE